MRRELPKEPMTTGIGSLPHHNIDAALQFAFQAGIPFLPQIPRRNPWEYMIPQALEGFPGLEIDRDTGAGTVDGTLWTSRSHVFREKLEKAFASGNFKDFEPSTAASSSWQPFLWELAERKTGIAKIQLAGPLTSQWSLRLKDGTGIDRYPDMATEIFRLVLARAMGMSKRLQEIGVQPILYLDEPGLYGLSPTHPKHLLGMQELKLVVLTLKKENVWVGLHCCSNTDWVRVLDLGLDIVSLDTQLSLEHLFSNGRQVAHFIQGGGKLSLGVVPTAKDSAHSSPREIMVRLIKSLTLLNDADVARTILHESIYTPACGLALHDPREAETILSTLLEFVTLCRTK